MIKILDYYSFRARVLPFIIVMFPFVLLLNSFIYLEFNDWQITILNIILFAFILLFAQLGRDVGYKKQISLFNIWGGAPTTQFLRHSSGILDKFTLNRYHRKLEKLIKNIKLPTKEKENLEPKEADMIYDSCVKYLRDSTRDNSKYQLLFSENVNYGFRRNLWGMKNYAIFIVSFCFIIKATYVIPNFFYKKQINLFDMIVIILLFLLLALWILVINKNWVKIPAFAYAKQLMETIDNL
jgi:hypothetical protein